GRALPRPPRQRGVHPPAGLHRLPHLRPRRARHRRPAPPVGAQARRPGPRALRGDGGAAARRRRGGRGVTPPDEPARQRIAADLGSTLFVEAGAGSGKTTALVGRIVALVTSGEVELGEIAAITFTEKAG